MYMKKYILFILLSIIPFSYSQIFNLYNNMSVIEKNIIKKNLLQYHNSFWIIKLFF